MKRKTYTPEMAAMLVKLAGHGHGASSVAAMLNRAFGSEVDAASVHHKAHALGVLLRRAAGARTLPVPMSSATESALREAARDRAMSVEKLASELLAVIIGDRLIDAVLDVPVTKAPQPRRNGAAADAAAPRS
jgi:hypothetical protein